jgi:PAS domain S-box-containing protein
VASPRDDGQARADVSSDARLVAARRLVPPGGGLPPLDRLAELAARLLRSPSAQVALLTDVQVVAGGAGLPPGVVGSVSRPCDSLCQVTVASGKPLSVSDASHDERVYLLPPVTSGQVCSYLGIPLHADAGEIVGALCVYGPAPRIWSDGDVEILTQLAASVVAELELAALARDYESTLAHWELAIDAAGVGSFDWDLGTGVLQWDDRLIDLFGYDKAEFDQSIDAFFARLHPDDVGRIERELNAAIATAGTLEFEYRVVLPSGDTRWIQARGRVLTDDTGRAVRVLGAVLDATELREGEARVGRVLESMSTAFLSMDRRWRVAYVNAEAERLLGRPRSALLDRELWATFPALRGSAFERAFRDAVATGRPTTVEAYYPAPLNAWYEVRALPTPDGVSLYFLDVTTRRASRELLELTAAVGEQLASSLDGEDAVRRLAEMVVPRLADWSVVSVAEPSGELRDIASAHVDPELRPVLAEYVAGRLHGLHGDAPIRRAWRTQQPVTVTGGLLESLLPLLDSPRAVELLRRLAPESNAIVPLAANGRVLGILSLIRRADRPAFSDEEVGVAVNIAARAALALENARLYAEQRDTAARLHEANLRLARIASHHRDIAHALQEAMLTTLPHPDDLELAARYRTATGDDQVGGDWYDAVLLPSGATTLVIGDVVGHDIGAAARMGQLRNMLRAFAWDRGERPSAAVARLDRAVRDLQPDTLATLLVATIEPRTGPAPRAVRWTNAGHPPPAVLLPDGSVQMLAGAPDVLLGVEPGRDRNDHCTELPAGTTLMFYTDGLVETRDTDLDERFEQLLAALHRLRALPLADLLDSVLAEMVGDERGDDVALLGVRLT